MELEQAHRIARERGPIPLVYWVVRTTLQPFFRLYFRLRRIGMEHIPKDGPILLASNHRSFCDPFMIGLCLRRPLRFVAKVELFDRRWKAWLLLALGAFPVRRGESDEQAMETARLILEQGGTVGIFPEGTRVRPGPLAEPRRGVGRLALETGAPVVPIAIIGTEDIRKRWRIRPRKVTVRCGAPLTFPRPLERPSASLAREVTSRVWSCVSLQWEWLGGVAPIRNVAVVGAGSWGTAVATLLARGGASVQLACRSVERARELRERRVNTTYLPGVALPAAVEVPTLADVRWTDADLVCLAVPSRALAATIDSIRDELPPRVGVLVLSKGLVAPDGSLPSSYLIREAGERPVACLGGPAHAAQAVQGSATLVVAGSSRHFCERLRSVFRKAAIGCETSDDLIGVQFAGAAKNAAALAAGAALIAGENAAGAVAGCVYAECFALARARGAAPESFAGLAGAGDLIATVLAPHSRNRRAGELLAEGVNSSEIARQLGQIPEALDVVPVLAQATLKTGLQAPAIAQLAALVEGRIVPAQWLARTPHLPASARAA